MNEAAFTPVASLIGGVLIGLSATLLVLTNGRIAGISGIAAGLISSSDRAWRASFLGGLVAAAGLASWLLDLGRAPWSSGPGVLVVSGLLVGVGTRLGNGCTSGHGVCGLSRLSFRSLVATLVFMAAGIVTVTVVRLGASP
ncbi:MAG: YeeE/YedE family protein [Sandaracinaceae bacterium]|nr:YeeE/YedE family protein [Sandaracinaceae bacterium]